MSTGKGVGGGVRKVTDYREVTLKLRPEQKMRSSQGGDRSRPRKQNECEANVL